MTKPRLPRKPAPVPDQVQGDDREEMYRVVNELADEFAYADRVEPDGTVMPEWVTPAFTRVTGYTKDELLTRPEGFVLVHPDDLPIFDQHTRQALAGHSDVVELRIMTKSGAVRWIHSRLAPVKDDSGRVVRIHGTARDITQRRRAEEDVRLHAAVFENLPFGIYIWRLEDDADLASFRLVAANPAATRMTGMQESEAIGKSIVEIFPGILATDRPGLFRSVIRSGQPLDLGEVRSNDQRIAERIFSVRAFPLPGSSVGVSFEDISDTQRARESLRRAEGVLVRAIQPGTSAVLVVASGDGKILDVNDGALATFGYERSQMLGATPADLWLWAHPSDYAGALNQARVTEKPVVGHAEFRRRNGATLHSLYSIDLMDYQGQPAVVLMLSETVDRRTSRPR
jgi:PAS domain S-box-containing protein